MLVCITAHLICATRQLLPHHLFHLFVGARFSKSLMTAPNWVRILLPNTTHLLRATNAAPELVLHLWVRRAWAPMHKGDFSTVGSLAIERVSEGVRI